MKASLLVVIASLATSGPPASVPEPLLVAEPTLTDCLVSIKDEVEVPAQEPGLLIELCVEEGSLVREGELLGQIDDTERQMQKRVALIEQESAQELAHNDINVRYADAAAKVARAEHEQAIEANRRVRGTFPLAEVRRLKLAWQRADLQIEQSQLDQQVAGFTSHTRGAEVDASDANIGRRRITSPVDGEVVARYKHVGEWVNPGDAVLRVVRFDKLRIEGFLKASHHNRRHIAGCPVTVWVELDQGRRLELSGKVTYVSRIIETGGEYRIWAEVTNREEQGDWLLQPGLTATMTIHAKKRLEAGG